MRKMVLILLMLVLTAAAVFAECSYCLDTCQRDFDACYAGCQEYGPPSPTCTQQCRDQYNRCFDAWYCGYPGCRDGGFRVQ